MSEQRPAAGKMAWVLAFAGTCAFLAPATPGCQGQFSGPYPCAAGYASCVNSGQNLCETNVTNDGANCGTCGKPCGVGASCLDGRCGARAVRLASLSAGSQTSIAVNAAGVFWSQPGEIVSVPSTGGSTTTVATNVFACGPTTAFAVDDHDVYYWANPLNAAGSGPPTPGGLAKTALSNGATTILVQNQSGGGNNGCPSAIAVDATNVYVAVNQANGGSSNRSLYKVPIVGGNMTILASAQGNPVDQSQLVPAGAYIIWLPPSNTGSPSPQSVPIAGGTAISLPVAGGVGAFTADAKNAYAAGSGCPCSNGNGLPTGQAVRVPLDGSPGSTLGPVTGQVGSMATDSKHVYWSTDTSVFRVPVAGGDVTAIAGNLTAGGKAFLCNVNCGGGGGGPPPAQPSGSNANGSYAIAVDDSSVYIADTNPNVNAILKVLK